MWPRSRNDFTVAIICALTLEADAVEAVFDETFDRLGRHYGKEPGDANAYVNGRIGKHNVVLCYLPRMGKGSAASAASSLQVSYRNIQLALVVGICGGTPSIEDGQIYLGDVVISDSVVEYDYGRQYPGGFQRKTDTKDTLGGRPDRQLRTFLTGLKATRALVEFRNQVKDCLGTLQGSDPRWKRPGIADVLFDASYPHKHAANSASLDCAGGCEMDDICAVALNKNCDDLGCDQGQIVRRRGSTGAEASAPSVYIGTVASADTVLKSGQHRDDIVRKEKVAAFEMEGAGVCNNIACIVIKGVCDYADSHKNKLWQAYAAATGASAAKSFVAYWEQFHIESLDASITTHFMVPFARNPRFVGRQHELQQLKEWTSTPDGPRKIAIAGLGGVGKTQVALELAYQTRDHKSGCSVFWLPCISREAVEQAYLAIAKMVGIRAEPNSVKEQVKTFFSQTEQQWLLIFDNVDDVDMWASEKDAASASNDSTILLGLKDFLPRSEHGRIVFTTRSRKLAVRMASASNYVIPLAEPNDADSMVMLQNSLIDKNELDDTATAMALLEQLSFLPLAIAQATAFINENGIPLYDYLELLREQEEEVSELLSKDFDDEGRYENLQNPVALTWNISFSQVQKLSQLAADYLYLMACINPRAIPKSFLPEPESRMAMVEALGLLSAYSFITIQQGDGAISMHRLVFLATRNWLRKEQKLSSYIVKAANRFDAIFPSHDHENRQLWRKYLPHILGLMEEDAFKDNQKQGSYLELLRRVASCLYQESRYEEAELLTRDRMTYFLKKYGDDQWETIECMDWLAHLKVRQRKLQDAEKLGLRAINLCKEKLGPDSLLTLHCMETLADLYEQQGRLDEAETLQSEVLSTRKKALGSNDYDTLQSIGYLASIYEGQGRFKEAEELQSDALKIQAEVLGLEHPMTLTVMHNLAMNYSGQGRLDEAERLMTRAFNAKEKALGLEHPDTLISMRNLGRIYNAQLRPKEAEELLLRALDITDHVLGGYHPATLMTMFHLGTSYYYQARFEEAEELDEHVLKLRTKTLGRAHSDTLESMQNLAATWRQTGKTIDALYIMQEHLELRTQHWGPDHPLTIKSRNAFEHWKGLYDEAPSSAVEETSATRFLPAIGDPVPVQETSDIESCPEIKEDPPVDDASEIEKSPEARESSICETERGLALRLSRAYPYPRAIGLPRPQLTSPLGVLYPVSGATSALPN